MFLLAFCKLFVFIFLFDRIVGTTTHIGQNRANSLFSTAAFSLIFEPTRERNFSWQRAKPGSLGKCSIARYYTHTHARLTAFFGTTRVSRYQKGETNLDFTGARDSEWQWHQLGHMQVCISLQTDNHASTPPLVFYTPDALPAAQPTASKH